MHILKNSIAAVCMAGMLAACGGSGAPGNIEANALGAASVGTINGVPIPESLYRRLGLNMLQKSVDDMTPEEQSAVLEQLVALMLVAEAGSRDGLDNERTIAADLELRRMQYLASATVERYAEQNAPSEAELRALYEERIQNLSGTEYKARHILLETEEDARNVIALLNDGGDFEALAMEHSTGPTGPNGGDLGWFTPDRMVEPFSNAVRALEVGSYSTTPVQTQFGWHVILLEDSRDQQPPGIESMRTELTTLARRQKIEEYVGALRERADVALR